MVIYIELWIQQLEDTHSFQAHMECYTNSPMYKDMRQVFKKFQKSDIWQVKFSDHSGMKLKINSINLN